MFPQLSHTPDFEQRFLEKRCGLSAGVYGTSERNYLSEFSTHMVYLSHLHVCVKCRKRARNFFGGGCALIKAFWTVSQWVNASQIAFNTNISPTHTPYKIVESRRDL